MTEKDYHLYGTKVLNLKTQENRKRLSLIRNKGFKLKNTRNRLADLYLEKQICRCWDRLRNLCW